MFSAERHQLILKYLHENGIVHVKDLALELKISETTIRRDLMQIEKEGRCKRVHGGAIKDFASSVLSDENELTMTEKSTLFSSEKNKVCKAAAKLVKDGDCVFVDGGTTTVPLIDYLVNRRIKIVTHNDLIIRKIHNPVAEIFVVGGKYLSKYAMTIGPIAYDTMRQFNFDVAFIGCTGVSLKDGIAFTAEMETRSIKEIAMTNAIKSFLLIDHNKLHVRGFTKLSELNRFDGIMCNRDESIDVIVPDNWQWID